MARLFYILSILLHLVFTICSALHPLDPLSESEITNTATIIKSYKRGNFAFNFISLKEPEKAQLLPYFLNNRNPPNSKIPRRSFTVLVDRRSGKLHEVVVNLNSRQVESWTGAPNGVQGLLSGDEAVAAIQLVRRNATVVERCRRLGWTNMSLVSADPWTMGYIDDKPQYAGKRLVQMYLYGRHSTHDNQYAHPFDFGAVFDLLKREVVEIIELPTHDDFDASNKEGNTVPREEAHFDPELRDSYTYRRDLRPVKPSQRGTSYTFCNNEITWQKYKMRLGFNGREGLVIYNVNYNDNGVVRPLFYRMSLAEMFIPYGDPRTPYYRKHVFDEGEYGVGFMANQLRPGLDCLGNVVYLNATLHNDNGESVQIPRVVCIHEEDAGILWKHTDLSTGRPTLVRSQRLVMMFIATVGNYDYIFTWRFYQDGSIEFKVKLTGILSTNLLAVNASTAGHGSIVKSQVNGQYHQHFFSLRLDAEIDGNKNSVSVSDVVSCSGTSGSTTNPYGQSFTTNKVTFDTAGSSRTKVDTDKSRTWIITNPNKRNPHTKEAVGWKLIPAPSPSLKLQQDSPIRPLAAWMDYHTWVLPYKENQLFPGGFYLNKSGLPEWVGEDEGASIKNTDVVLWHNFGISHIPRVEDFPVMPAEQISIFLKPYNFFKENPAVDVPQPK